MSVIDLKNFHVRLLSFGISRGLEGLKSIMVNSSGREKGSSLDANSTWKVNSFIIMMNGVLKFVDSQYQPVELLHSTYTDIATKMMELVSAANDLKTMLNNKYTLPLTYALLNIPPLPSENYDAWTQRVSVDPLNSRYGLALIEIKDLYKKSLATNSPAVDIKVPAVALPDMETMFPEGQTVRSNKVMDKVQMIKDFLFRCRYMFEQLSPRWVLDQGGMLPYTVKNKLTLDMAGVAVDVIVAGGTSAGWMSTLKNANNAIYSFTVKSNNHFVVSNGFIYTITITIEETGLQDISNLLITDSSGTGLAATAIPGAGVVAMRRKFVFIMIPNGVNSNVFHNNANGTKTLEFNITDIGGNNNNHLVFYIDMVRDTASPDSSSLMYQDSDALWKSYRSGIDWSYVLGKSELNSMPDPDLSIQCYMTNQLSNETDMIRLCNIFQGMLDDGILGELVMLPAHGALNTQDVIDNFKYYGLGYLVNTLGPVGNYSRSQINTWLALILSKIDALEISYFTNGPLKAYVDTVFGFDQFDV